jgi:hypothetical protein
MSEMSRPPRRIWLQFYGDEQPTFHRGEKVNSQDVTWCSDQINEHDVEYVRATKTPEPKVTEEELRKVKMALVMLTSIALCGEELSKQAKQEVKEAHQILDRILVPEKEKT